MFESEHFKKDVGLVTFTPSVSEWVEKTDAIGLFVKKGSHGVPFLYSLYIIKSQMYNYETKI